MADNKKLIVVYKEEGAAFYHKLTNDERLINYWENKPDAYIYERESKSSFEFEDERNFFVKNMHLWSFISSVEVNHTETYGGETLLQKVMDNFDFDWESETDQEIEECENESDFHDYLVDTFPRYKEI